MSESSLVRFGAFELDKRTGELRKHGVRLKIQDQPFQVLQALLERPGELVTREELQTRIWAHDTFVDFDQSLNRAVNKVRDVLSDTAGAPRFIETLPRRGYRFIAPVEAAPIMAPAEATPNPGPGAPQPGEDEPLRSRLGRSSYYRRIGWVVVSVLAIAAAGLWLVNDRGILPPARVIPLTTLTGTERFPAFSPDGKQVAFTWNGKGQDNDDIYVKVVGDETPLRLTSDPAPDWFPAWSPNGRKIAFSRLGREGGIYTVSPLGGPATKLAGLVTNSRPSWSADGKFLLVVQRYAEGKPEPGEGALFLVPAAGEGPPRLILPAPRGTWYRDPTYAPDGRSLAFLSCTGAVGGPRCNLQVTGLKDGLVPSGVPRPLQQYSNPFGVAWTADGASLIYGSDKYLWRVGVRNGQEAQRLELAGIDAYGPAIDYKAGRLAFSRTIGNVDIWRLDRDGRDEKPYPFLTSSLVDANPQYSPDGRHIAFESGRGGGDSVAIWVASATDPNEVNQITRIASPKCGDARWSPDGKWIAFEASGEAGGWDIWVVEASGGSPRQLTHDPGDNILPTWSRDGRSIYFSSKRSGRFEIWRVTAQGGVAVQITRTGGLLAIESTAGDTLYFTGSDAGTGGLSAKSLPDGDEKQLINENVAGLAFAVFADGVYYLHGIGQNVYEIRFHEFATGQVTIKGKIEGLGSGLAVSPDRQTFLFSRNAGSASDLMLIENFR